MVSQSGLLKAARDATLKLVQREAKEQTPIKMKMKGDKATDYVRRLKKLSESASTGFYAKAFDKLNDVIKTFEGFSNFNNVYGFSESDKQLLESIGNMADEKAHEPSPNDALHLFFLTALLLKTVNDPSYTSSRSIDLPYIMYSSYPVQVNPLYVELMNEASALSYNAMPMKVEESNKTGMFGRYFQGGRTKKRHGKKRVTRKRKATRQQRKRRTTRSQWK